MADLVADGASAVTAYWRIAALWVRASLAYPVSFWVMAVSSFLTTGLDFVAIAFIFTNVDQLGGFSLREIAFLYGATGLGIAIADIVVGNVERLGQLIRLGRLDTMMTKPVPLLVQVCAHEFALRRLARIVQSGAIFAWACWFVDWTPARVLTTVVMAASGSVIFFCLFVGLACIQFWTADSAEVANAFTYGGNALTQYPLSVYPRAVVQALTFVLPIAFVNWYPALSVLGRDDPFAMPAWLQHAAPVAAAACVGVCALTWRTGVRHYRSTGS
ncbi:MAG: ABC-2 family transporter protein [Actinomycetota bacterium]|nr:ABC-2 family transporter protein [Actinomycetota bacterium]